MEHDFSFLDVISQTEVIACFCKSVPADLHALLHTGIQRTMISKEKELSDDSFLYFSNSLETSKIEEVAICLSLWLRKASVRIAVNIVLNSNGAGTHSCFTPFVTGNASDAAPFSSTCATLLSRIWQTMAISLSGNRTLPLFSTVHARLPCQKP